MKNKFLKSTVSCLLAALSLFVCACSSSKTDGEEVVNPGDISVVGTHDYTAPLTDKYVVKNGQTSYQLLIPQNAGATIVKAKDEFVWLFKKATGVTMNVVTESGDTAFEEDACYISLGETNLLKNAQIEMEKARLGTDGGKIVTKGNSVFIFGGADKGTLYAVYTYMNIEFKFEQYFKDCYEMDTGVKNVMLRDYAVIDIPDIAYRTNNYGMYDDFSTDYDENNFATRMKMGTDMNDPIMPVHPDFDNPASYQAYFHNTSEYLPVDTYSNEEKPDTYHPLWFSDAGVQLCYTAHGDETEWELMAQECAKKVINSLKIYTPEQYPLKNTITFTCEDGKNSCTCDACAAMQEKYGQKTAAMIQLANRMGELVEEWMEDPENAAYKREDFTIIVFAYNDYTFAPVSYNEETKEWSIVDDSVRMRENVGVYLAPISSLDYQSSLYAKVNERGKRNIDAWAYLTDNIYFWWYSTNFLNYNYMYDTLNFFNEEGYQYTVALGTKFVFNQAQHNQKGSATAWHNLKMYLDAKLSWNCNLNAAELVDNWFNAMYKEAAPIMKSYFESVRLWNANMLKENNLYVIRSVYLVVDKREYWPLATLRAWMTQCDQAVQAIEQYKVKDPALYEKLYYHIAVEWLSPAYIAMKLYTDTLGQGEYDALAARIKDVVNTMGMAKDSEHGDLAAWANAL